MNYESVIKRYKEMYRQAGLEEITSFWDSSEFDLNVYVHSPFCPRICKYCRYRGKVFSFERDYHLYKKYYSEYLPAAVKPFLPIIGSHQIGNYFFGGGTPSLMRPETMRSIFNMFPGFREVKSKTFEIHPAVWTEEQLDTLAEYKFNCCIICIQSFDKAVLNRQNRLPATREAIYILAQKIKERGMHLAADLIYRMDPIDADDIFKRDLDCVAELDCDIISLHHSFDEINADEHVRRFLEIIDASPISGAYRWEKSTEKNPTMPLEKKKARKALRYVKNSLSYATYSKEIFGFLKTLDECSKKFFKTTGVPSLIGFGSYQNSCQNTFSTIRGDTSAVEYIEINNNWTPEYYITFNEDRIDIFNESVALLEKFNALGTPPAGITSRIIQGSKLMHTQSLFQEPYLVVGLEIRWRERTVTVAEFLGKVNSSFRYSLESPSSMIVSDKRRLRSSVVNR